MQRNDNLELCTECDNDEFEESRHVQFAKGLRKREEYEMNIPHVALYAKLVYTCTKCGHVLDK
ncbi:hypothetical protein D3C85_567340 [compost metagenome]